MKTVELEAAYPTMRTTASKWRVLVIEDEPDNLLLTLLTLQHFGTSIFVAHNGKEALDLLAAIRPNFIISDLSMPEMSGWALKSALATHPDYASLPIIALTAHAMTGDKERVEQAGFVAHITKPVSPDALMIQLFKLFPEAPVASTSVQTTIPAASTMGLPTISVSTSHRQATRG